MHIDEEEEKKTTDLTESILSLTRIRRIIKADPDTKQISSDAVFLITKATVRIKLLLRLKWPILARSRAYCSISLCSALNAHHSAPLDFCICVGAIR